MLDDAARRKAVISPEAASAADSEIRAAVAEWADVINNGNVDAINALYTPDAVLLATFDPRPRLDVPERKEYFTVFKSRRQLKATIDECHVAIIGSDGAAASGLYTFRFIDEAGAPQTARARFTFVFSKQPEGDWLIVAHHSSQVPAAPQRSANLQAPQP